MTAVPVVESRLPVGSSAKRMRASLTRAGDGHALLLAAGKLPRQARGLLGQPQRSRQSRARRR